MAHDHSIEEYLKVRKLDMHIGEYLKISGTHIYNFNKLRLFCHLR